MDFYLNFIMDGVYLYRITSMYSGKYFSLYLFFANTTLIKARIFISNTKHEFIFQLMLTVVKSNTWFICVIKFVLYWYWLIVRNIVLTIYLPDNNLQGSACLEVQTFCWHRTFLNSVASYDTKKILLVLQAKRND